MKDRAFVAVIVAALVLFLITPAAFAFETKAKQMILIDTTTNTVLLEKNADEKMPPSSMSKLMTLYMLFSRLKEGSTTLDREYLVSEKAWRMGGSKMFIEVGKTIKVEDLIRGIIIVSGNDACIAVAEGIAGTEEAFAALMNDTAKKLGMNNSHFVNSTGWPDDNHYSTARDLATLAQHLVNDFPEYYHYFKETSFTFNNIKQPNRNRLIERDLGVDGLKTGHTEVAGYGIVLSSYDETAKRRLVLVINGLGNDNERVAEGYALLNHGTKNYQLATLTTAETILDEAPVRYGSNNTVKLSANREIKLTVPQGKAANLRVSVEYNAPLTAPVAAGAEIGKVRVFLDKTELNSYPLFSKEAVTRANLFRRISQTISYYLGA